MPTSVSPNRFVNCYRLGSRRLELMLQTADGSLVQMVSHKMRVEVNHELQRRLAELLGAANVQFITEVPKPTQPENGNGRRRYAESAH